MLARPAAPGGRSVQSLSSCRPPPIPSRAGSRTAAIPAPGCSPASRPTGTRETAHGDATTWCREAGRSSARSTVVGANRIEPRVVRQPAGVPAGTTLLPGRAVPEPAQPLLLRPVPLRHGQHRLAPRSSRGRLGAAGGAGEREPAAAGCGAASATPPRTASAAPLGWTTRNFLGSSGRILDLTSRISKVGVGEPFDWGLDQQHLQRLAGGLGRLGQGELQPERVGPAAGVPLAQQHHLGVGVHRAPLGVQGVPPRRRPAPRSRCAAKRRGGGFRCRCAIRSPTGAPRRRAASFCASFNACTPDVVALLRQNRGARHADRHRRPFRGSTARSIRPAARIKSLEVT